MNALRIKNLCKDYGSFKLENISFELPEGYILGYIGQNGAGKTTTIKLIMEQIKRSSGEISVFGQKYSDDRKKYKNMIGFIADESYLPESFTAKALKDTFGCFYSSFDKAKFDSYLKQWDIPNDKKIKDFSKGMKIKLMFASVLARDTKLLILDEPTSGLDPVIRDEILELLQEYIKDGNRSILFSTHIMSDLEKIADYLFFIEKGKMVFNDTKDNILENYYLIKGDKNGLNGVIEEKLIGYKKSSFGFEGLIHVKDSKVIDKEFLVEKPTVDDIVVYHINRVKEAV